jgi:hypothetical protein
MYSVLNCHNVEKHTKFFLGYLRFCKCFMGYKTMRVYGPRNFQ